ncbi:diguanylate cyclase domain-containing protein [Devosia salina]|uniref:Diguanylate cyclase n=1 Tax=Devosia salina TaxID=2860336 RepID=A0ABX8WJ13_9HYPH|nr:diguanylate cyclase [Devosia salina]QYO78701.1 diguanylate cyclase [Devosia salina]
MLVQPFAPDDLPYDAVPLAGGDAASGRAFLRRLRDCAGMAGAGLVAQGLHWVEMDGMAPPEGITPAMLGLSGRVATDAASMLIVVPIPSVYRNAPHWLVLWDSAPRPAAEANLLLARVTELVAHAAIERRRGAEIHRRQLIERASATARIGIWSCTLPDETLSWSDGVYDLFELPRGSLVDRTQVLRMYTPESAARMQVLRADAIARLGDFNLDVEIITATGKHRWMRITATVDGVNGRARRIFGMKQNITEEKLLAERTRRLAETDSLTGLANRSLFQARLDDIHGAVTRNPVGTLLLVDLDRFKAINDELGHSQGDACLVEAGQRLVECCPPGALVARIGGDEFAIIIDRQAKAEDITLCIRIVEAFRKPFHLAGQARRVGVSVGMARRDGQSADALYRNADTALYQAKSAGRDTWRQYSAA